MAYIGSTPTTQSFISGTDYFNGTGSQTSFTLSRSVGSVNDIEAVVNNVVQRPNDAYNISGNNIVFTSAPSAGTNNIYVRYLSTTTQSITPSQNTVSYSTLNTDMQNLFGQSFTNRIINGAMVIDQRNAGAAVTSGFPVDRFNSQITNGAVSMQQSSVAPTGFTKSLSVTVTSASVPSASDRNSIIHNIEGFNIADFGLGTASPSTFTLSFWVRSSLTGTFSGMVGADTNPSYVYTYVINAANTWEYKTITIPGTSIGTWGSTNGFGLTVRFDLGTGSDRRTTPNTWNAADYRAATGAVQLIANSGATLYLTGVQLEKGSTATSFDYRPYGTELQLCQRYYEKSYDMSVVPNTANAGNGLREMGTSSYSNNVVYNAIPFCVRKRATPTVTPISILGVSGEWEYGRSGASSTAAVTTAVGVGETSFVVRCNVGAAWVVAYLNGHFTASAEL